MLERVIAGKVNRLIAEEMAISIKTVEAHRARLMEKLAVNSVAELVQATLGARALERPARGRGRRRPPRLGYTPIAGALDGRITILHV